MSGDYSLIESRDERYQERKRDHFAPLYAPCASPGKRSFRLSAPLLAPRSLAGTLAIAPWIKLSLFTGLALAVVFYAVMLDGVAVMGRIIWWMARNYPQRPSLKRCMVFAGYVATPLFLSGLVALYPLVWLCALVGRSRCFTPATCCISVSRPSEHQ